LLLNISVLFLLLQVLEDAIDLCDSLVTKAQKLVMQRLNAAGTVNHTANEAAGPFFGVKCGSGPRDINRLT
jgi:hypothetical protein